MKNLKQQVREVGTMLRNCGFITNDTFDRNNVFELDIVIRRLITTHGYKMILQTTKEFANSKPRYDIVQKAPYFSTAAESIIQRIKSDQAVKNKQEMTFAEFELAVREREKGKLVGMREMASHLDLEDFCLFLQLTDENFPKDYYDILMYYDKEFRWGSKQIINRFFNKDLTPKKEIT